MARIAGIDLPKDKRVEIGLTYIYGIGRKSACDILAKAGVDPDTTFSDQFISCEMKLLKPSPEFYRESIRRIGLPAGEILFIDDNLENVEAARKEGMQARHLAPGIGLAELLQDL